MILTCPECATSYFVDDSRVGPNGRVVKCSNCGARWQAFPEGYGPAEPPAEPPPPPPSPVASVDEVVFEAPPAPVVPPPKPPARKRPSSPVVIWVGAAVAAAGLIAVAIVFRGPIVQMLPASAGAYASLGMPVSSLVVEKVRADAVFQGGRPVLQVSGQIRNQRAETAQAPPLKISLLDWTGKTVGEKIARPLETPVPGKAVRYFAVTLADPPLSVHDLEVSFDTKPAPPAVKAAVSAPTPPAK